MSAVLREELLSDKKGTLDEFSSDKYNAQLEFDYNRNPKIVSSEDERKQRYVMQCFQKHGDATLSADGKDSSEDMEGWIEFYRNIPGLFHVSERRREQKTIANFSLSVNSNLVELLVDARSPASIKSALVDTLKSSGGQIAKVSDDQQSVRYLALIRSYGKTARMTIYKAEIKMQATQIRTFCAGGSFDKFEVRYDQIDFEANNDMLMALYPGMNRIMMQFCVPIILNDFKRSLQAQAAKNQEYMQKKWGGKYKCAIANGNDSYDTDPYSGDSDVEIDISEESKLQLRKHVQHAGNSSKERPK